MIMSNKFGIFLRTAYNYDGDAVSNETAISEFEPTLTIQDARDDCDINVIMERFGQGVPLPVNLATPMQGDFTGVTDYQSSLNLIRQADEAFMEFPAKVRSRFDNDPAKFLDFISDPVNQDEAISLGIAIDTRPADSATPKPKDVSTSDSASGSSA